MSSKAADKRFASLKSDPRFRKQKADKFKVEIDDRFKSVLDEGGVFAKERGPGAKGGSRLYRSPLVLSPSTFAPKRPVRKSA